MSFAAQRANPQFWFRLALALLVAAGVAFVIHVLYGQGWAQAYVDRAASAGRLNGGIHQPYPAYVVVIAFLTELLPMAGKVFLYMLVRDFLPGSSRVANGLCFGLLLMAISDALVRLPLMNFIVGNPLDVVLIQGLEGWAIGLATGVIIAVLVP